MKKYILTILIILPAVNQLVADDYKDSLKIVDVEEVLVIATPKENRKLRELPNAVTLFSQQDIQATQISTIKSLTGLVPNMFIPDYGSKLTSAIYIRGIGSRINTPSVGLYVDNIPYIDKSAFDFNYYDVERIDILRGPQGTLYGRNTMGGLIKVHTKSPFSYQGTDLKLSAGTYNNYKASLTHYHRISPKFAFSAGGFYEYADGFFKNSFLDNQKVDRLNDVGGRLRGIIIPSENLKIDMNVSYEYTDQGGYPYFYTGNVDPEKEETNREFIGKIATNEEAYYRRSLLNAGVTIEHQAKKFVLSAVTGYQYLNDRMHIDQDFTHFDYFNLTQEQKYNTISEEIIVKSKPGKHWEWTTGIFGFYQGLKTEGPVRFKEDGIREIIENNVNSIFANMPPAAPQMKLTINSSTLDVSGDFDTPMINGAVYHQSTFNNLLTKGLSFTAGLRLDYEKMSMKYNSASSVMNFDFDFTMPPYMYLNDNMDASTLLEGKLKNDYLQLLPKFALQYEWKKYNNVYATISRGYRSGGYNVQMFSNLAQSELKNAMKHELLQSDQFGQHPTMGGTMYDMIDGFMKDEIINVEGETTYKPEYSWNYELGTHLTLWNGRVWADLSAFYMETKDQQVSQFAPNEGLGRVTVNVGKSRSYGAEAAVKAMITESLSFNVSYGYTRSKFRDYETLDDNGNEINYKDNYVPFAPQNTFSAGGQYIYILAGRNWLDRIQLNLNYSGAGRIYWNEQNTASQNFYGTLNGRLSFGKGNGEIALWARNILDEKYQTFYFESRGNGFEQKGRPVQIGVEIRCVF